MKFVLTLGLLLSLPMLAPASAHADDDDLAAPELASSFTNNLGNGSCVAIEKDIAAFEKCLRDNKATEGSRTGIYKCGNRRTLPERC